MAENLTDDIVLLDRFRSGDDSALGMLYERYEPGIFRFIFGMTKNQHLAEDILQETFIQAIRKADQIQQGLFKSWIYTVAYQQTMYALRKKKQSKTTFDILQLIGCEDKALTGEGQTVRKDELAFALSLLQRLNDSQQTVIRLRIFEGLKFQDVADHLKIPLGTALARMHDGLKKLRQMWEEQYA